MKWSSNETFQLVSIYKEYECLWNVNSVEYRNRDMRRTAESEIVARVGIEGFGVRELRQKVKNIRCTYNQECNKILRSQEKGLVYVSRLRWFKMMDVIVKRAKGLIEAEPPIEDTSAPEEVVEEQENTVDHPVIVVLENLERNQPSITNGHTTNGHTTNGHTTNGHTTNGHTTNGHTTNGHPPTAQPAAKRRRIQYLEEAVKELKCLNRTILLDEKCKSSDNSAFGSFVAASLEHLPVGQALLAQQEIHSILMKYRLHELSASNGVNDTRKSSDQEYQIYLPEL